MSEKIKCYISTSVNTNTSALRRILGELGVLCTDAYDFYPGDSLAKTVIDKIKESDFVIAVISDQSRNVLFEIGICIGLQKPFFILIDPKTEIPQVIYGHLFLRTTLNDTEILRATLKQFIENITRKKQPAQTDRGLSYRKRKHYQKADLTQYLYHVQELRAHGQGKELEELVLTLLKDVGLQVASQPTESKRGVDFVVWSEGLAATLGNPILVEVKIGALRISQFQAMERLLSRYIGASDAKTAIILYLDRGGKRFKQQFTLSPLILRWDLEDFIKALNQHSFEDVVLMTRNRIVHGVSD